MIGNVSTEESRNEMRKSPGAPRPLAKATTFCFHALKPAANRNSSNWFPLPSFRAEQADAFSSHLVPASWSAFAARTASSSRAFCAKNLSSPFAFACVGVVLQRDPFLTENLLTRNLLMERAHPTRRIGVCGRVAQA